MEPTRIVHVVDDDEAIRDAIGMMLRSVGYEVHLWPNGASFLAAAGNFTPACVLLDIRMPDVSGLEVHERLKAKALPIATIILTGHSDVPTAVHALRAGAANFLEKPVRAAMLTAAVHDALETLASSRQRDAGSSEARERLKSLSPREVDVLRGLAQGKQNKTIALDLGISPRTVEVYRANIMEKLDANSLSEVLFMAFSAGLDDLAALGSHRHEPRMPSPS